MKKLSSSVLMQLIDRIEVVATNLEKLSKCIYGNGEPGLKDRMARLEGGLVLASFLFGGGLVGTIVFFLLTLHKGG